MKTAERELVILINDCGLGNNYALEILYKRLSSFLNSYAMKFVRCEALSNEVLQDSFTLIWQNAADYDVSRGKPLAWICTIVRSRAIDKLRAERKHLRFYHTDEYRGGADDLPGARQPELELTHAQSMSRINHHLAKLPLNEQLCITLAYFHECSRKDLADILGTNVNTIKSWLHRGLIHLQRYEVVTPQAWK